MTKVYAVEAQRCEGDHFFEDVCNTCGAAQPSGPCAVCPHIPPSHPSEHYVRRPCRGCGGHDLRSVRVRMALDTTSVDGDLFIRLALDQLDQRLVASGTTRDQTRFYLFGPPYALYAELQFGERLLYTDGYGWAPAVRVKT